MEVRENNFFDSKPKPCERPPVDRRYLEWSKRNAQRQGKTVFNDYDRSGGQSQQGNGVNNNYNRV